MTENIVITIKFMIIIIISAISPYRSKQNGFKTKVMETERALIILLPIWLQRVMICLNFVNILLSRLIKDL